MNDFPVRAADVARWFVRTVALATIVATVFGAMQSAMQFLVLSPRFPAVFMFSSIGGLVFWIFVWLFSSAVGDALAFQSRGEYQLSMRSLGALAWPCLGFLVGAQGLASWISNVSFALIGAATSPNLRTPLSSLLDGLGQTQTRELWLLLPIVLQIGLGLFLAFVVPRLISSRQGVVDKQTAP